MYKYKSRVNEEMNKINFTNYKMSDSKLVLFVKENMVSVGIAIFLLLIIIGAGIYFVATGNQSGSITRAGIQSLTETSLQGATGIDDQMGVQGPMGITGPDGQMGPMGPVGYRGVIGPQGPMGVTGYPGPNGQMGPMGPVGYRGVIGPQGLMGVTGYPGPDGNPGLNGKMGPMGPVGYRGPQGPMGVTGYPGPIGGQGPVGYQGPPGPIGGQGLLGYQGPPGVIGPQGPKGVIGDPGPNSNIVPGPVPNSLAIINDSEGLYYSIPAYWIGVPAGQTGGIIRWQLFKSLSRGIYINPSDDTQIICPSIGLYEFNLSGSCACNGSDTKAISSYVNGKPYVENGVYIARDVNWTSVNFTFYVKVTSTNTFVQYTITPNIVLQTSPPLICSAKFISE